MRGGGEQRAPRSASLPAPPVRLWRPACARARARARDVGGWVGWRRQSQPHQRAAEALYWPCGQPGLEAAPGHSAGRGRGRGGQGHRPRRRQDGAACARDVSRRRWTRRRLPGGLWDGHARRGRCEGLEVSRGETQDHPFSMPSVATTQPVESATVD
jgi:hypothetical protein